VSLDIHYCSRLAAVNLAHRVAKEQGVQLGTKVGYHIGGNCGFTSATRLRFVTTGIIAFLLCSFQGSHSPAIGIALEMMKEDPTFSRFSHIVVDEVHERNVE
jgi:HrpA-like RNA helicase